jgi:hypothetical protein
MRRLSQPRYRVPLLFIVNSTSLDTHSPRKMFTERRPLSKSNELNRCAAFCCGIVPWRVFVSPGAQQGWNTQRTPNPCGGTRGIILLYSLCLGFIGRCPSALPAARDVHSLLRASGFIPSFLLKVSYNCTQPFLAIFIWSSGNEHFELLVSVDQTP